MEQVNDIFADFAACFTGRMDGGDAIAHEAELDRAQLDYSMESLKIVDEYLTFLHEHPSEQFDQPWVNTMLWGGAYVGETIRRNAPRAYDWVDFDEFILTYPETTKLLGNEKQLPFCALLTAGEGSFTLPINKILRFINDGPGDSVWFYAACEVREP